MAPSGGERGSINWMEKHGARPSCPTVTNQCFLGLLEPVREEGGLFTLLRESWVGEGSFKRNRSNF